MSYKTLPYTYGSKSLDDINALTGMSDGDTVYNLDWNLIEVYDGNMWVNDQAVPRTIESGEVGNVSLGMAVKVNASNEILRLTSDNDSNWQDYVGIVVRIKSDKALVAHFGRYQILVDYEENPTISNGVAIRPAANTGLLREDTSPTGSGGKGVLGYTVEAISATQTNNYLCWATLQTIEMS